MVSRVEKHCISVVHIPFNILLGLSHCLSKIALLSGKMLMLLLKLGLQIVENEVCVPTERLA